jgi:phosphoglycolate phosphatase
MTLEELQRKLILFDMDGTLVRVGQWYEQAYEQVMPAIYGVVLQRSKDAGEYSGNTQPNIFRAMCRQLGVDEDTTEAGLSTAVGALAAAVIRLLPRDLRPCVLPGVVPLLGALRSEGHDLGLVTGTVSAIVRTILERTGLHGYFPVCACGDEGEQRIDLLRLALARAAQTYDWKPTSDAPVVVGDAPRDVQTGLTVGARTVAVATGAHTLEVLATFQPDVLLPDLVDWQRAMSVILNHGGRSRVASVPPGEADGSLNV